MIVSSGVPQLPFPIVSLLGVLLVIFGCWLNESYGIESAILF